MRVDDRIFAPTEISGREPVSWVRQGIVLCMNSSLRDIWPVHLKALDLLLHGTSRVWVKHGRRSDVRGWTSLNQSALQRWEAELRKEGPSRPFLRMQFASATETPEYSVVFQDIPAVLQKYPRLSFVEVQLPLETSAQELEELTGNLMELLPVWQGSAGFFFVAGEGARAVAYDQIWAWARRYWGIDIFEPTANTWEGIRGLMSVNWLTIVGNTLLETLSGGSSLAGDSSVSARQIKEAWLVRAGSAPTIGDRGGGDSIDCYIRAAEILRSAFVAECFNLPGMFGSTDSTLAWRRRFLAPDRWMATP